MSLKTTGQILRQNHGNLSRLLTQSEELLNIQRIVRKLVNGDIFVAALSAGELHLITSSAALATRLNYSQKILINALSSRQKPYKVDKVKVSVRPSIVEPPAFDRQPIPISTESARQISETAKYIEDDALRKALIRLSGR